MKFIVDEMPDRPYDCPICTIHYLIGDRQEYTCSYGRSSSWCTLFHYEPSTDGCTRGKGVADGYCNWLIPYKEILDK